MASIGLCLICEEVGKSSSATVIIDAVPMCRYCVRSNAFATRFPVISQEERAARFLPTPTIAPREVSVKKIIAPKIGEEIPDIAPQQRTFSRHAMIVKAVCEEAAAHLGMTTFDVQSRCRGRNYGTLRQVVVWILRNYAPMSYSELGRMLHQHHTTVMHTADVAGLRYRTEKEFATTVATVWKRSLIRRVEPQIQHRADSLVSWAESQTLQRRNLNHTVSELKTLWHTAGAA